MQGTQWHCGSNDDEYLIDHHRRNSQGQVVSISLAAWSLVWTGLPALQPMHSGVYACIYGSNYV